MLLKMRWTPFASWVGVLTFGLGVTTARASDEDVYARVTKQSAVLEQAGEHSRAAARLETIAPRYPQDYPLHLRLAWLHFQAGHHARAERGYRRALALTTTSWEARLGLAWSLLRQGDRPAARRHFRAVLDRVPDNRSALAGRRLSQEPPLLRLDPTLDTSFYDYQGHPTKSWGLALTFSLPLVIHEQFLVAASYRYQRFMVTDRQEMGGRRGMPGFGQHEVYLSAGLFRPAFGVLGQYAYLNDGRQAHVAGFSARYSPWGDVLLAGNVSLYGDMTVARVAPAWRIPLWTWLQVTPGLALQVATTDQPNDQLDAATDVLVTGSLSLTLLGAAGRLWIGGKLGDEVRPADLDLPVVYNIPERVLFGVWVGGSVRLGGGWSLRAAYQIERLESRPVGTYADSNLHLVTAGVAWSPGQGQLNRR